MYPFLFHYRYGVFKALEGYDDLEVTFVSDIEGRNGIESIPVELLHKHHQVKTRMLSRFTWQSGLVSRLISSDYDAAIFHGDMWSLSTWVGALVARTRRKRIYFWTIGWHRPDGAVLRRVRVAFYRLAHELLIYGNIGKRLGAEMGFCPSRMTVIYNSHESSQTRSSEVSAVKLRIPRDGRPTVGAVIRLTAVKRLDLLLEAAVVLRMRGLDLRIVLAGDGPERQALEDMATANALSVLFPGAIYAQEDLEEVYGALDLTVVPAAAGLTVIQSLNHGVPVVTDDDEYGQMPESEAVIEGLTGGRYAKGDVRALADAIQAWLNRVSLTPEETARHSQNEVSARWTPEAQAERIHSRLRFPGTAHASAK